MASTDHCCRIVGRDDTNLTPVKLHFFARCCQKASDIHRFDDVAHGLNGGLWSQVAGRERPEGE
jgi:hypothetical protein